MAAERKNIYCLLASFLSTKRGAAIMQVLVVVAVGTLDNNYKVP